MAKRVAQQRRGLLYGMIAAIFIAVILAVFLVLTINTGKTVMQAVDPTATDSETVQASIRDSLRELEDLGILPAGESVSLTAAIDRLIERNQQYEANIGTLAYLIRAKGNEGLRGEALHSLVRMINDAARAEGTGVLDQAEESLQVVPTLGIDLPRPDTATPDEYANQGEPTPESLAYAIDRLGVHVRGLADAYKQRLDRIAELEQETRSLNDQIQAARTKFDQDVAQVTQAKDAQIADLQRLLTEARNLTDQVRKEYEDAREAHNKSLNEFKAEKQELVNQLIDKDSVIKELADRIQRAQARLFEPDGEIARLDPGEQTGYIDLGRGNGVFNGLTFSVYDPVELGREVPKKKATIRLTNVMANSSEFYITDLVSRSNPIVEGDIITNPSFDQERPFHFTLVGRFDLNDDGIEDTDWVKSQIRKFGGTVRETVTPQTDYLVTGEDPMNFAPMGTGPQTDVVREKLRKEQIAYGEATDMASRLHIPVLNQNRFMSLIGMTQDQVP